MALHPWPHALGTQSRVLAPHFLCVEVPLPSPNTQNKVNLKNTTLTKKVDTQL